MEELCERTKILSRILHPNPLSAAPARSFDQSFVAILGYIDAYHTNASGVLCTMVMVGSSPCVNVQHTHGIGDFWADHGLLA
jgi:hypothetical protein